MKVMSWHTSKLKRVDPVREAELGKRLVHPNLVQTYTFASREKGSISQIAIVQDRAKHFFFLFRRRKHGDPAESLGSHQ